eukprot:PhF_6_TR10006/c0_g1_i1/m.15250
MRLFVQGLFAGFISIYCAFVFPPASTPSSAHSLVTSTSQRTTFLIIVLGCGAVVCGLLCISGVPKIVRREWSVMIATSSLSVLHAVLVAYTIAVTSSAMSSSSSTKTNPTSLHVNLMLLHCVFAGLMFQVCPTLYGHIGIVLVVIVLMTPVVLATILYCVLFASTVVDADYAFLVFWYIPGALGIVASIYQTKHPQRLGEGDNDDSDEFHTVRTPDRSANSSMDIFTVGPLIEAVAAQSHTSITTTNTNTNAMHSSTRSKMYNSEGDLAHHTEHYSLQDDSKPPPSSPLGHNGGTTSSGGGFFDSFMSSLRVPFFIMDAHSGVVQFWSEAMEQCTSLHATMVVPRPVSYVFEQLQPQEATALTALCLQSQSGMLTLRLPDGSRVPMVIHGPSTNSRKAFRCVSAHPCVVLMRIIPLPGCVVNFDREIVTCNVTFSKMARRSFVECHGMAHDLCIDDIAMTSVEISGFTYFVYAPPNKSSRVMFNTSSFYMPMSPPAHQQSNQILSSLKALVDEYKSNSISGTPQDSPEQNAAEKLCNSVLTLVEKDSDGSGIVPSESLLGQQSSPSMMRSFAVMMSSNQSMRNSNPPWGQLKSQDPNLLANIDLCSLPDEEFKVGRGAKCHVILHDPFISSTQFSITRKLVSDQPPEKYVITLRDYSANGTFINVRMIGKKNRSVLYPGDQITFRLNGGQKFFAGYIFVVMSLNVDRPVVSGRQVVSMDGDEPTSSRRPIKWKIGTELLGKGGNAEVFLGINLNTGKLIAVKRVLLKTTDERSMRQFLALQEEIDLLKDLIHRNIVQYLGTDQNETHLHILLEFVPGGSIRHLVDNFGVLSEIVILKYSLQIIEGLKYLHSRRVVHGDLKCANVLVTDKGEVKITDFGTAKVMAHEGPVAGKVVAGTLLWMAPELFRGGTATPATDIWSYGCCLLEMMTAQSPWSEYEFENESQIITLLENTVEAPELPTGFSKELLALVKDCLILEAARRPTCEDISWRLSSMVNEK